MDQELLLKLTADIVVAYLGKNIAARDDVASLILDVRAALETKVVAASAVQASNVEIMNAQTGDAEPRRGFASEASAAPSVEASRPTRSTQGEVAPRPAVPINESVTDEYLINLEDGKRYRSLRRHLMAKYGMSPDDYRRKWGLPADYPMVAPSYARERSEVAKRTGLGKAAVIQKTERSHRSRR